MSSRGTRAGTRAAYLPSARVVSDALLLLQKFGDEGCGLPRSVGLHRE